MSAKYKIKVNNQDNYINVPLNLTHSSIGQEDVIESVFVDNEVEKAINEIVDYEKIRFSPKNGGSNIIRVDYRINILKNNSFPEVTTMENVGFTNDDIKYRRNNFKRSFLNLMLFDSDIPTKQNLISYNTLYNKINRFDLVESSEVGGANAPTVKDVSEIPFSFIVEDPITRPRGFAEGYYLYDTISELPKSLYMRSNYNNAKTGISTDLVTSNTPQSIENAISKLHTKFDLKNEGDIYYYELDMGYSGNVSVEDDRLIIDLYEIQVT